MAYEHLVFLIIVWEEEGTIVIYSPHFYMRECRAKPFHLVAMVTARSQLSPGLLFWICARMELDIPTA